jgi:ABC-type antimicrobial peptide transport system permease subunit
MSMYSDDNNVDTFDDGEDTPPEESNNRTFLFIAGGLGILVLIGLCAVVGYFFLNNNNAQQTEATAQVQATFQQATIVVGLTQNARALAETQAAGATATLPPTNTPVIAQASLTPSPTQNPATATVGAAFTQIAGAAAASTQTTLTVIATSTALPNTGFADDIGLPGMFAFALAFVIVIFLVRRLRAIPAR